MEIQFQSIENLTLESVVVQASANKGLEALSSKRIVIQSRILLTGKVRTEIVVEVDDQEVCRTHDMHKALRVFNAG